MKKKSLGLECLLVFVLFLIPLQSLIDVSLFSIYQSRDIERARLLASGHLILFGPELSGGSHLPGPFYYFLLAGPLKLGFAWKAVCELEMAFAAAAAAVLWWFSRRRFGVFPACYALLCAACWDYKMLLSGNNSSFLPLFVAGSLAALCESFDPESSGRGAAWLLFCLLGGLGAQLHMTMAFLLLGGLVLHFAAPRFGLEPVPRRAFAGGLAVLAALTAPYLVWLAGNALSRPIGQTAPAFTLSVYSPAYTDPAGALGLVILRGAQKIRFMSLAGIMRRYLLLIPFEAILPFILFKVPALAAPRAAPADERSRPAASRRRATVLAAAAAASSVPYAMALALSPARYTIVFRLSLDLFVGAALAESGARLRTARFYAALFGGLVAFTAAWHAALWPGAVSFPGVRALLFAALTGGALAALVRNEFAAAPRRALLGSAFALPFVLVFAIGGYAGDNTFSPGNRDLEALSKEVRARTGWSYDELKRRVYYVNVPVSVTPEQVYESVASEEKAAPRPAPPGLSRIDGFFAVFDSERRDRAADARGFLSGFGLAETPRSGIESGAIALGEPVPARRFVLIPYEVKDTERFPPYFHNGSEAYSLDEPEPAAPPGAATSLFRFNDCPGRHPWCEIVAEVRISPEKTGRRTVSVVLKGDAISQASEWVSLDWVQALQRPYFTASCAGKEKRVLLAEALGPEPDGRKSMNHSILGPYERTFHVDCPGAIDAVSIGYESSRAYSYGRPVKPPLVGRRLYASR